MESVCVRLKPQTRERERVRERKREKEREREIKREREREKERYKERQRERKRREETENRKKPKTVYGSRDVIDQTGMKRLSVAARLHSLFYHWRRPQQNYSII